MFMLSPGVNVSEIDLTTIVPTVSTSTGAVVGQFVWGPVDFITLIDTEVKLVSIFGKPNSNTYRSSLRPISWHMVTISKPLALRIRCP